MSSIDKYVEGEARSCNPKVHVYKRSGQIIGEIDGHTVFSIADRYGYLNESECNTIHSSIKAYEEEERERLRREQERLENERKAARNKLKADIVSAKNNLTRSLTDAKRVIDGTRASLGFSSTMNELKEFNISAFANKVKDIDSKLSACESQVEKEYDARLRSIESIRVNDNDSTQKYISQSRELNSISTNLTNRNLPIADIEKLKLEFQQLKQSLSEINKVVKQLESLKSDGLIGSIVADTEREIHQFNITSIEDVEKLLIKIQGRLTEVRNIEYDRRADERHAQIATLNGALKACLQIREYVVRQPYEAASHRGAVVELANKVLGAYSELETAAYTTCSREKFKQVYSLTQEIIMGSASDEKTVELLKKLLDEYLIYKRDDEIQADNYKDYLSKIQEFLEHGVAVSEIEAFDPHNYEEQKRNLNKRLLNIDIEEAISRSRTSLMIACKVMEEMGYKLLHHDFGSLDESNSTLTHSEEGLACEAVFVRPGCEGVVWQIVASGCGITRKIIGVKRTNGMSTSVARVQEVAKRVESSGEIGEFFNRYAEEGGGALSVRQAVDTDTEGNEEVIRQNGTFNLDENKEKEFDTLVALGSAQDKAQWASRISLNEQTTSAKTMDSSISRSREASRTATNLKEARHKKN